MEKVRNNMQQATWVRISISFLNKKWRLGNENGFRGAKMYAFAFLIYTQNATKSATSRTAARCKISE